MAGIDQLIINSAYREPTHHWKYDLNGQTFIREPGRRPAGYFVAGQGSNQYNDIGKFVELPLVNKIRPRVKAWREAGYPGVTGVTRKLLEHWNDKDARQYQFFYCQMDAMETLVWLTEAPETDKVGIDIPTDGGLFRRICTKLCTGGGKTTIMAMLIAWMICNKVTYPHDRRFSKYVFIVAPGLTVKSRLQVLQTGGDSNYYMQFNIVPIGLMDKLRQGKVMITNWQALAWESEEAIAKRRSVDKRGAKSDEAYTREVLGEMANASNILVINDEAHHAWRKNPENKIKLTKEQKEAEQQATIWVSGLDRIHKTRRILTCYDFSATPFAPSGKKNDEEALFGWIVSDFGLNDGIESGLVKTPRVVVRDDGIPDADSFKSKLYHIYKDDTVTADINRAAAPEEPLPDLLTQAYYLLGKDWQVLYESWKEAGAVVPPVMITVANRTETAARIKYAFDHSRVPVPELCDPNLTIHIDSKTMDAAANVVALETDDEGSAKLSKADAAAILRETVDTVGQKGKRGEQIRNVISVGMLSEGWDAKTVTHILGLRAFSSQLLCEQVVGRGLRRTSYDLAEGSDMFTPEYVNIFGIPFTFLPHESDEQGTGPVTPPKTQVEALKDRAEYEIQWPNIIRLDRVLKPQLKVDLSKIDTLELNAADTRLRADLAPIIDGKTDLTKCTEIDLEKLDAELRLQRIIFEASGQVYDLMKTAWQNEATKFALLGQVIRLVEEYLQSGAIVINPPLFNTDPVRKRIIYMMNMNKIVQHLWGFIKLEQTEKIAPVFDPNKRVRSTADMPTWFTSKPCCITQRSQISHCVYDSTWEATESYVIEKNKHVDAWVKNDHLGFEILYVFDGVVRKYVPDFLIRLDNGKTLVLETKGQETRKDKEKRKALAEWVEAVNALDEFGQWCNDVSYSVADVDGIIAKHATPNKYSNNPNSCLRLYVEKYDPYQGLLLLDFINDEDFVYFKYHGDNPEDISIYEDEPTMIRLSVPKSIQDTQVEGMIVETSFEKIWNLDESRVRDDSKFIAWHYNVTEQDTHLLLTTKRHPKRNEIHYLSPSQKTATDPLLKIGSKCIAKVYKVGNGSWSEITDEDNNFLVFDCGTSVNWDEQTRADCVVRNGGLIKAGTNKKSLVISHWDADHCNILREVDANTLTAFNLVLCHDVCISLTSQELYKKLEKNCPHVHVVASPARAGHKTKLILYDEGDTYKLYVGERSTSINKSGLLLSIANNVSTILLCADHSYWQISEDVLSKEPNNTTINMVVPHHGGNTDASFPQITISKAGKAVISTDGFSYEHPKGEVVEELNKLGFTVIRTDQIIENAYTIR